MSKLLFLVTLLAIIGVLVQGRPQRIPLKRVPTPSKFDSGFLDDSLTLERVDLVYPYFARAEIGDLSDNWFAVSLFNSRLFLSNCSDTFKTFNCSAEDSSCFFPVHKKLDAFDFPYYSLAGRYVMINMTLGNFGRGERIMALYANVCTKNPYNNPDIIGAVGLSLSNSNFENFDALDNKFSIYLESDGSDGELIFGEDSSHEVDEPSVELVGVTLDWELPLSQITLLDSPYDFRGKAIFDINSNFIGIPDKIHWQLMKDLKHIHHFNCLRGMVTPNCTYLGDINDLPSLILTMADGETVISLPPAVYTRNLGELNRYTCLLVSLQNNPEKNDTHLLPVTKSYENYVLLGAPVMQYYYTVFNYTNVDDPRIRLFVPKSSGIVGGLSAWAIIGIILGALLLIGIIVGSVMAFKKNREKKRQESLVNPESRVGYISYNQ
jgi:hypothetical protein